ncbi:hypothetical protein BIW11_05271 [Tropilaelaps mercedesae]|uniref:Uncharacterized protein n=1 Tax=Tropilaelaps mercedesae TaxID=418985 RepID=A0A1V9Y305_9ACAR|nr:hypothetical protein BIW11_05271 [Tropilaelaps mercedesae]
MALVDSHQDKLEIEVVRRRIVSSTSTSTTVGFSAVPSSAVIQSTPGTTGETASTIVEGIALTGSQHAPKASISSVDNLPPQQPSPQQPQLTSQSTQRSAQEFEAFTSAFHSRSSKFADKTDSSESYHPGEMKISRGDLRTSEAASSSLTTTVNISGAKFDLGSDFAEQTIISDGSKSAPGATLTKVVSNPFAGVERILESEAKSSEEQISGGELNRLESHETKITGDNAYVRSHILCEHKVSSTSSTMPLSISVKGGASGRSDDDVLLISPTGRPIKERYYKPLPDEQLKEVDDIMAPILSKKKVFTSSSFYEDAKSTYPTVEEQIGMARKIAESLSSDSNAQSKGANMFFRRVKRSHKWVHQAPGISESEYTGSEDCSAVPDPEKFPGVKISKVEF